MVGRSNNNSNANGGLVYANANNASSNSNTNNGSRLANRNNGNERNNVKIFDNRPSCTPSRDGGRQRARNPSHSNSSP